MNVSTKFDKFKVCSSNVRAVSVSFCFKQPFSFIINLPLAAFPRSAYGYRQKDFVGYGGGRGFI